jgi:magnesium transporter
MEVERRLVVRFLEDHPEEAASLLERNPCEGAALLANRCPAELAAALLRRMAPDAASSCLAHLPAERAAKVATSLAPGALAMLLRRLPIEDIERIARALPAPLRASLSTLLRYPPGTAGALLDPTALALPRDLTVGEAIERMRRVPHGAVGYLYVVDREQELVGVVSMEDLLFAEEDALLGEAMTAPVTSLPATLDREAIVAHRGWIVYHAMPVVDEEERFLGAIAYETFREIERELREAASSPERRDDPSFDGSEETSGARARG